MKLGISPAGYLKIERGATEITLKRILELSQILETPLEVLLNIKTTYQYYQEIKEVNNGTVHYVVDQVNQFNRELVDMLIAEYKMQIISLKEELDKLKREKK